MQFNISNEAEKIWVKSAVGEQVKSVSIDIEAQKRLLNIFSVGDYYYYLFNVKELKFDFMSKEITEVLGYKHEDVDLTFFLSKFHPDDQPWFLNIETKVAEFYANLKIEQIPNYKVRYDYRIQKSNGDYIRILQQVIALQHSEVGGLLSTFGVHTNISHIKMEGKPVLSFIGLNGEPSYIDVPIEKIYPVSSPNLSKREQEVLLLIVKGMETKEIAQILGIGIETINTYRRKLLEKTKSKNTYEMITMTIRKGWI